MTLGDLGEFGFIDRLRERLPAGTAKVGVGDDAAVVRPTEGTSLVATTDALVEGVHFRWDWSKPPDVGHKAVTVNVSDLAAMGARPRWVLITIGAPSSTAQATLEGIYDGLDEACVDYDVELIGGDTVRAEELVLSVTALGEVDGEPLLRSGAKIGDVLAVTGPLGRAAAGVNLLLSQNVKGISPEDALACMSAHARPTARVAEGRALRMSAHAAIDLSDGLAPDAGRLAQASNVGVEIEVVPVADEARRVAEARGWEVERMTLGGGEDYELLVALDASSVDELDLGLIPVGRVVDDGVWLVRDGERHPLDATGWDHFQS